MMKVGANDEPMIMAISWLSLILKESLHLLNSGLKTSASSPSPRNHALTSCGGRAR